MQNEYKNAMQKLTLSDDAKARILKNVKEAYENSPSATVVPMKKKPRFSTRQIGAAAAAVAVLLLSSSLIYNQFIGKNDGPDGSQTPGGVVTQEPESVVWEELASIDEIKTKAGCHIYTPGDVSDKKYTVEKVEAAAAEKHVKITYASKKTDDKVYFEYKEEENAEAVTGQFADEVELATETFGDADVTMYGNEKCSAMTWQQENCTFAVRLTEERTKEEMKKIVSGTKKKTHRKEEKNLKITPNAVGWKGNEESSTDEEKKDVLKRIYEELGFRIYVSDTTYKAAYKLIEGYASFSFFVEDEGELKDCRIIGYAGWEGSPEGVLANSSLVRTLSVDGREVFVYENVEGERIFVYLMDEIVFTVLIPKWTGEEEESAIGKIMDALYISTEEEPEDTEEPEATEAPEVSKKVLKYRNHVTKILKAAEMEDTAALIRYMEFPVVIGGQTWENEEALKDFDWKDVFSVEWKTAVHSYNVEDIGEDTVNVRMGNETNAIVWTIKNNSVKITELCYVASTETTTEPSEE